MKTTDANIGRGEIGTIADADEFIRTTLAPLPDDEKGKRLVLAIHDWGVEAWVLRNRCPSDNPDDGRRRGLACRLIAARRVLRAMGASRLALVRELRRAAAARRESQMPAAGALPKPRHTFLKGPEAEALKNELRTLACGETDPTKRAAVYGLSVRDVQEAGYDGYDPLDYLAKRSIANGGDIADVLGLPIFEPADVEPERWYRLKDGADVSTSQYVHLLRRRLIGPHRNPVPANAPEARSKDVGMSPRSGAPQIQPLTFEDCDDAIVHLRRLRDGASSFSGSSPLAGIRVGLRRIVTSARESGVRAPLSAVNELLAIDAAADEYRKERKAFALDVEAEQPQRPPPHWDRRRIPQLLENAVAEIETLRQELAKPPPFAVLNPQKALATPTGGVEPEAKRRLPIDAATYEPDRVDRAILRVMRKGGGWQIVDIQERMKPSDQRGRRTISERLRELEANGYVKHNGVSGTGSKWSATSKM